MIFLIVEEAAIERERKNMIDEKRLSLYLYKRVKRDKRESQYIEMHDSLQ